MILQRFGHELPLAERLAELDDEYDILEYGDRTPERHHHRPRRDPTRDAQAARSR
ncbi:hypothetical protein ACFV2X_47540 [Streptomyces sp. NPDC059679]|uniref:hypothetical protein n=1 Tax=Streptomyces sp. NPDC059679 TaxID=3346903 RepID=UPI0036A2D7F7